MAITDNNFTRDELQGALQANPELVTLVSGFITDEANKEHPLRKAVEPAIISPVTSRHATEVENVIKELTGLEKSAPTEKYYDYMRRAVKTVTDQRTAMETELTALKGKSDITAAERQRIKDLEAGILQKDNELKTKLEEKEKEIVTTKARTQVEKALAKISTTYKKDLDPQVIELVEKNAVDKIMSMVQVQSDGKIVFVNEKGEILKNQQNYQTLTAEDMLAPELKGIIDAGRKAEGGGTDPAAGADPNAGGKSGKEGNPAAGGKEGEPAYTPKFTSLPETVKTQEQLSDYLLRLGLTDSDQEFTDVLGQYNQGDKRLPLR